MVVHGTVHGAGWVGVGVVYTGGVDPCIKNLNNIKDVASNLNNLDLNNGHFQYSDQRKISRY